MGDGLNEPLNEEKRSINLDNYFELELLLESFINDGLLGGGISKDEELFNEINAVLERNGYKTLDVSKLSDVQKEAIKEAYREACGKMNVQTEISKVFVEEKK